MKSHPFSSSAHMSRGLFSVLTRMLTVDLTKTLLAVLSVLLLIIISRQFANVLRKAFDGEIANETIFILIGLRMVSVAINLLPSALFASVLMVLGRMYRDNEMAAMATCGVGVAKTYQYIMLLVIPLSLIGGALSLAVLPWTVQQTTRVLLMERQTADVRLLVPGRFNEYGEGDIVFYVEAITDDNQLSNIFVQHRRIH